MKLVFGLMLLQTAACLEFDCSFNPAADSCYAALGHKLNLLMVDSRNYTLMLRKTINHNTNDPICRVKNGKRTNVCDLFENRPEVTVIDGTLIINPVKRADSGNYTVTLSDSQGTETKTYLQVIVEAPVTSVEVSIICSSSGGMEASCSSDGDQLVYSWTLNGDPLMDGNSSIHLNERTEENISCSVKNNINEQKIFSFKQCPGTITAVVTPHLTSSKPESEHVCPDSVVFVLVWCFQMMLLFGLLGGFHIYMRHMSGKKQEDQQLRMRRFTEGHEDSGDQQQISAHL